MRVAEVGITGRVKRDGLGGMGILVYAHVVSAILRGGCAPNWRVPKHKGVMEAGARPCSAGTAQEGVSKAGAQGARP